MCAWVAGVRPRCSNSDILAVNQAGRDIELAAIFSSCTTTTKNMALLVGTYYFVRLTPVKYRSINQVSSLLYATKQVPSVQHSNGEL
jgi:hypothetical protein